MQSAEGRDFAGFAAAAIQLYSRLWWDLEELGERVGERAEPRQTAVDLRLEMLRLELVILLDGCDSARWRMLLPPPQRRLLRATLAELAATLEVSAAELEHGIVATAQNQLFDAVLHHCNTQSPQCARTAPTAAVRREGRLNAEV